MSWSHFEACVDQQRYVPLWAVLRQGAIQKHRYDWTHRSSPSSHTSRAKRIQFESIPVKQLRAHSGLLQVISNSWCRRLAISPLFQGAGPNPKTYDPMICSQGHQNSWRQSHTLRVVVRWKHSREKNARGWHYQSIALCMKLSNQSNDWMAYLCNRLTFLPLRFHCIHDTNKIKQIQNKDPRCTQMCPSCIAMPFPKSFTFVGMIHLRDKAMYERWGPSTICGMCLGL